MPDLPRVTDILREMGVIDTSFYTEDGRDRGTALHLALQYLDEGDLDESSLDEALRPHVAAYRAWLQLSGAKILTIEEEVQNTTLGYRGRLDRRILDPTSGAEYVVDLKRGGPDRAHPIQLAAYAACFPRPLRRASLHFNGGGTLPHWVEYPHNRRDRKVWEGILIFYQWRHLR